MLYFAFDSSYSLRWSHNSSLLHIHCYKSGIAFFHNLVIVGVVAGLCLGISKSSRDSEQNNNLELDMHLRLGLGTAFLASGLTSYVIDSYRLTTNASTSQTGLGLDGFSILFVLLGIGMLYRARGLVKR